MRVAVAAVQHEVTPEVRIAREDLVAAVSGHHHLHAGITDSATQQVPGDSMRVCERTFGMVDGIVEMIGQMLGARTGSSAIRIG